MVGASSYVISRPIAYVISFAVTALTNCSFCATSARRSAAGPFTAVPSSSTPVALIGTAPSIVRQRPRASKFSRLKPSGSIRAWQLEHTRLVRCLSSISRTDDGLPVLLSSRFVFVFGGGGGGGAARIFSRSHLPRMVGAVRSGYDVTASTLALPSRPHRFSSARITRRKWLP